MGVWGLGLRWGSGSRCGSGYADRWRSCWLLRSGPYICLSCQKEPIWDEVDLPCPTAGSSGSGVPRVLRRSGGGLGGRWAVSAAWQEGRGKREGGRGTHGGGNGVNGRK